VCPVPGPNMVATCESGACGATCANGFMDCDGNPANGCEYAGNSCPLQTGCVPMCTKLQACCNGVCQPLIAPCAHI
jgi:hypothetical protein